MALTVRLPSGLFRNVGWNSAAVAIHTVSLQLVVFPVLGRAMGAVAFSELLSLVAILNIAGLVIGTAHSNFRMRNHSNNNAAEAKTTAIAISNASFLLYSIVGGISVAFVADLLGYANGIWAAVGAIALAARIHVMVDLRLELKYVRLALAEVFMAFAYALAVFGIMHFEKQNMAITTIVAGEIMGLLAVIPGSQAVRVFPSVRKGEAWKTVSQIAGLALGGMATNVMSYGDRIFLTRSPIVSAIPVFYVASLGGRLSQMAVNTVSSVLLAYLARARLISVQQYVPVVLVAAALLSCVLFALLSIAMPYVISWLYPTYQIEALEILMVVNLGFSFKAAEIMVKPLMLRIATVRALTMLEVSSAVSYVAAGLIFAEFLTLEAFSTAFAVILAAKALAHIFVVAWFRNAPSVRG